MYPVNSTKTIKFNNMFDRADAKVVRIMFEKTKNKNIQQ